jgi:Sugar (and other) transporter
MFAAAGSEEGAATRWVVVLCWIAVALDGFDLVVLGAVTPALLEYREWGLTAPQVGAITSYGLFGMLIGALGIGTLADVIGRKRSILTSVVSFSVFTALCAFAPTSDVPGSPHHRRFRVQRAGSALRLREQALSHEWTRHSPGMGCWDRQDRGDLRSHFRRDAPRGRASRAVGFLRLRRRRVTRLRLYRRRAPLPG